MKHLKLVLQSMEALGFLRVHSHISSGVAMNGNDKLDLFHPVSPLALRRLKWGMGQDLWVLHFQFSFKKQDSLFPTAFIKTSFLLLKEILKM